MDLKQYLPEGRLIHTHQNTSAISETASMKRAMEEKMVLEGVVLKCDSNLTLTVALGEKIGFIPKSEVAIGTENGSTRDIAIISRVGKPVSFHIIQMDDDSIILSRRSAQIDARDYFLHNLKEWDVIDTTVTHIEPFGAFLDMGCGLPAMISIENISSARIPHPSQRLEVGQNLKAVIKHIDPMLNRFTLSLKELLGTWEENAAEFSQGETVPGIVRSIKPYGSFVELSPNLSGLTEPFDGLEEGDWVSVFIKAILPEKRKIKLIIINKLDGDPPKSKLKYFITDGNVANWKY